MLALGAEVVDVGPASSERLAKAEELVREHGYFVIPPYDDEQTLRRMSSQLIAEVASSEDTAEGLAAFAEKRAPQWRGK